MSLSVLRKRLFAVLLAITFLFCLFLSRFFYIQVVWDDELRYRAIGQWTREIPVIAERGKIFDRNGELLAGNVTGYSVYARAAAVEDAEGTAQALSGALGLTYAELYEKLTDRTRSEVTVIKQAEKERVLALEGLDLPGVYYARDNLRFYPYGALGCQILGFTSADRTGTTGLEGYYDRFLRGKDGEIAESADLVGAEIEGAAAAYLPAEKGLSLTLTVDARLQALCEEAMGRALAEHQAKSAQCILLDPDTFEVLAMVCLPSYDLNEVPRDDLSALNALSRNRTLSDVFEPGSTFKIVTAAADIEESLRGNPQALSVTHIFPSSRTRTVDGTTIRCWSDHKNGKHSNQTLAEALNNSCNPCFVDIALSLGEETFYDYLEAFRFGRATGIDFSGESIGMLLPEGTVRDCDLARIGFGQTIAVTALQLACTSAAAVNGGYYYVPRLVKEIASDDGSVRIPVERALAGRTVSEEASSILCRMLEGVVRDGSGKNAYIEGSARRGPRKNTRTGTSRRGNTSPHSWDFSPRTTRSTSRSSSSTSRRGSITGARSPRLVPKRSLKASSPSERSRRTKADHLRKGECYETFSAAQRVSLPHAAISRCGGRVALYGQPRRRGGRPFFLFPRHAYRFARLCGGGGAPGRVCRRLRA